MRLKTRSLNGSMTVEASLALPLFIFFFVNILTLFNILKVQVDIEAALHQTGSELSLLAFDAKSGLAAVSGDKDSGHAETIAGAAGLLSAFQRRIVRGDTGRGTGTPTQRGWPAGG